MLRLTTRSRARTRSLGNRAPGRNRPDSTAAVKDAILRISAMVEAHPEIAELDCNPLVARPDGAVVVDSRVRLHYAPPAPPLPSVGR